MGFMSDMFKGSGGSLVGGTLGAVAGLVNQHSANKHNMAIANMNAALQKEFAQNSIRWKVEDAKRAGLHPMAALGISPSSFSPVSAPFASNGLEDILSNMGQNVDRAALAAKTAEDQQAAKDFDDKFNALRLRNMELQNDALLADIESKNARTRQMNVPPAPKVNISQPFGDQPDAPPPLRSGTSGSGVDTFSSDPASLFTGVIAGDGIIPVYNSDVADPLSESLHSDLAAKYAYLGAIKRREILGPPRSTWSKSQTKRIESGKYRWVFDALEWIWRLEPNSNLVHYPDKRTARGRLVIADPSVYR